MGAIQEAVVQRFYEEVGNARNNGIVSELFTSDHVLEDPQIPAAAGPQGVADTVAVYQTGLDGHWHIEELISAGDQVIVRWTGTGTHVGDLNGIPPTGRPIRVSAISIHQFRGDKICRTRQVWDTLGLMQQIGAAPGAATQLLREAYSAFARGDIPVVLAAFAPDIEWTTPDTVPFGGTYTGHDGVGEFFGHLADQYDELWVLPTEYVEQGAQVMVLGRTGGRATEGSGFEYPFVHAWEFKDGLASKFTEFYDTVRANAALGVPAAIDLTTQAQASRR
jgi:steroid delta-isomerase-like uncharacterized protein